MSAPSTFRSMLGLHAWSGLLLGWVSYLIFLTGTLAYFQAEITQWMQPSLQHAPSAARAIETALGRLRAVAPQAREWIIRVPAERDPSLIVVWQSPEHGRRHEVLNAATGEPARRIETLGGRLFYSFHFTFLLSGLGYWIAGAAAIFMLVAIVTGLVVHRKVFADFFTFRPAHAGRRAWLDAHNLSSVLALPFHIVIVYTGLVTLMFSYMPKIVEAEYGEDARGFFREAFARRGGVESGDPLTVETSLENLPRLAASYETGGYRIVDASAENPAAPSAKALLSVMPEAPGSLPVAHSANVSANVYDVLYDLHLGHFASSSVRWLLFASGVLGSAMIATGLIVWTLKRRERAAHAAARAGCYAVERLNVGVITGLLVAVAAYFLANRLLPADLADREIWEVRSFFLAWAIGMAHPFLRPANAAWREQLWTLAALFGALPIVSGVLTDRPLPASVHSQDWVFVGVEVAMLVAAAAAALAAWRIGRHPPLRLAAGEAGVAVR